MSLKFGLGLRRKIQVRWLSALLAAIVISLGVMAVPSAASAAGCDPIARQQMRFANSSPWRYGYSSSSGIAGYAYSAYTYTIDGVCANSAGNLWYRRAADPSVVYIYSGHRIPL